MRIITVFEFIKRFDTDDRCLDYLFSLKYSHGKNKLMCENCHTNQKFYKLADRKCYACSKCRFQVHPLAGTIFHKSSTPLTKWFYALYLCSISKNGVAAKELQRQLKVTYKCALRMSHQVKKLCDQIDGDQLEGIVEVDETYHGGKNANRHASKKIKYSQGRSKEDKQPILGMVQRNGTLKAQVVAHTKSSLVMPILRSNIKIGIEIMTDEYKAYSSLEKRGYIHSVVNHSEGNYVSGNTHTNTIEGFWGQLKRSINGTYHCVSKKYLQLYVDEFAWRYNHRKSESHPFDLMIQNV